MAKHPVFSHSVAVKDETIARALKSLEDGVRVAVQAEGVVVTGSRASGAALKSLLSALAGLGLITDRTVA